MDNISKAENTGNTLLITVEKACEITGIGRNTMLKITKLAGFPAIRFPR